VLGHAARPPSPDSPYGPETPIHELPELKVRAADVQASMTVLGRPPEGRQPRSLDLRQVDLRRIDLSGARLEGGNLLKAHLEGAVLNGADLEDAVLFGADLKDAILFGAHLKGAKFLPRAHLGGAYANQDTTWPDDFKAADHGVIIEDCGRPGG
jgi:hypothetical protein